MNRIKFMNISIDKLTMSEAIEKIDDLIQREKGAYVVTPNVDHIVQLETDNELKEVYKNANLILADGKPLIWISKLYRNSIKEKISGSDIFPLICDLANKKNYSMYFLGGKEGVAYKAIINLKKKFTNLKVVGYYSPSYNFENDSEEMKKIKNLIKIANPDILIVALGCPKQEKFMYYNCKELNVPISLGLGATIDFEAGTMKRAPKWMSNNGLEWLFRIFQEPKRMAKRYFINDRKIFKLIYKYRKQRK